MLPGGLHATIQKKEGKNEEKTQPIPGNLCAYGGRRKEQKTERTTKERNRERTPNPATRTIWSPLTTRIEHTVGLL